MNYIYFNQKYFSTVPSYENDGKMLFIPEPWLYFRSGFVRMMAHTHLSPRINAKVDLPLKNIWLRRILKNAFDDKNELCIILNAHFYNLFFAGIYQLAKEYYRKVKIIFIFSDKIEYFQKQYCNFPSVEQLKEAFDLVITYNVEDAKKYQLILDRPCFPIYHKIGNELQDYSSDVFFVGSNKSRLDQLISIFEFCYQNGLKCDFHINNVEPEKQKYKEYIVYNTYMDYSEVLERVKKTKCVLNIVQNGGAGVTLRDYEAFTFGKIILTNNYALKVTGMYSRKQVIWINELKDRVEDIISYNDVSTEFKDEFSLKNWCEWLNALVRD